MNKGMKRRWLELEQPHGPLSEYNLLRMVVKQGGETRKKPESLIITEPLIITDIHCSSPDLIYLREISYFGFPVAAKSHRNSSSLVWESGEWEWAKREPT